MPPINRDTDLEKQLADLRRDLEDLRAGSISSRNGSVTLPPGSTLKVVDRDGDVLALIGSIGSTRPTDGQPEQGLVLRRDDNSAALSIANDGNSEGAYRQVVSLWDRTGRRIVADDGASGSGLARPYIPVPLALANYLDMPGTDQTAWTDVHIGTFYRHHPKAIASLNATCDTSGATGELRVLIDDVQVGDTLPVAFAVSYRTVGPFVVPGEFLSSHRIRVQARRTAGAGKVRVSATAQGVQS